MILDCESFESTISLIASDLSTTPQKFKEYLFKTELWDIDHSYEMNHENGMKGIAFECYKHFGKSLTDTSFDSTAYYHITRVSTDTDFKKNGILPTILAMDHIWEYLLTICNDFADKDQFAKWRRGFEKLPPQEMYSLKMKYPGPFGLLIKEIAFRYEECASTDFLGCPEIIYDITLVLSQTGEKIRNRFVENTTPCIVKFVVNEFTPSSIGSALLYLHLKLRDEELTDHITHSFDGHGTPVSGDQIIKTEFYKDRDSLPFLTK